MIRGFLFAVICILLLLKFSACNINYYYPATQNIGALKEKGDLYGTVGFDAEQVAFAAGYEFTENIGLIGNFRAFSHRIDNEPNYQAYFWEPELVLTHRFRRLDQTATNFFGSVHVAYGMGQLARNQDYFSLGISRFSLQPGFFFSNNIFDVGVSARLSRADYAFTQLKPYDRQPNITLRDAFGLGSVGDHPYYFLEPAITFGVGYKSVKLRAQLISIAPISDADMNYVDGALVLSANFLLNVRKKE